MNFNNFTIKAQEAVQKAIDLAQASNQQMIEPAHLLKGVMLVGENVTHFLFQKLGVNVKNLDTAVDKEIESYPRVSGGDPMLSRETNAVFSEIYRFCEQNGRPVRVARAFTAGNHQREEHCFAVDEKCRNFTEHAPIGH